MNKVLIEVFIPALDCTYDVFVPMQSPLHEVLSLLKKAVTELSGGQFAADRNTVLCRREDGAIMNINLSVYELGIQNGSRLMLI